MKVYKTLILSICSLVTVYLSSSCERDDICAEDTPTTPMLIIKFIDDQTVSDIKQPNQLQVKAVGFDEILDFTDANQDSIMIPLRTGARITDFEFTIDADTIDADTDAGEEDISNTDTIGFQYTVVEDFVSSACGFRVNYEGFTASLTRELDDQNWIQRISIEEENITDEETAHILIFH